MNGSTTSNKPDLLLHICCAPCATHPLRLLADNFRITGYFFNPNLFPEDEHETRLEEARRYFRHEGIRLIDTPANHTDWLQKVKGYESEPEGGARCEICFEHRLQKTAEKAIEMGIPTFSTTLTVGPRKTASVLFSVAKAIAHSCGIHFLEIDFKKKDGFKKSCLLSKEAGLYRQDYCGCEFSIRKRGPDQAPDNQPKQASP